MSKKNTEKDERRSGSEIPNRRTGFRVQVELNDSDELSVKVTATTIGSEGERVLLNKDGSIATEERTGKILHANSKNGELGELVEKAITAHTEDVTEYLSKKAKKALTTLLKQILEGSKEYVEGDVKAHAGLYDSFKKGRMDPKVKELQFKAALDMVGSDVVEED